MGRPGRSIISHSHKPAKASAVCSPWWKQPPDPVPHATTWNTILGLEKQVLWQHGTPERIESDNGTHFQNNLIDTWANEHGTEWNLPTLQQINTPTQLGVVCKLTEGALNPLVQITDKDIKQNWPQY
ncbi:hypothetical protein QYF61_012417 [Mycteria americana]|uniref:Integrase catalytic domain-containing protein n=1 Tax=Mycteria americana TaxID=33587 RepID=A0AAN7RY89_MYCAM|nr:hypothetical protein QYF61_012417 [Mycteria americana]